VGNQKRTQPEVFSWGGESDDKRKTSQHTSKPMKPPGEAEAYKIHRVGKKKKIP